MPFNIICMHCLIWSSQTLYKLCICDFCHHSKVQRSSVTFLKLHDLETEKPWSYYSQSLMSPLSNPNASVIFQKPLGIIVNSPFPYSGLRSQSQSILSIRPRLWHRTGAQEISADWEKTFDSRLRNLSVFKDAPLAISEASETPRSYIFCLRS